MEELKYKVEFETDPIKPSELVAPETIQALVQLNQQIDEYKAQLKDLESKEKEQGQLTKDQAEQQQQLKLNLKATQDQYSRINREIKNFTGAANENINTYQGLVNENKRLMDAMRNLPLDATTGELERLQAQYNKNNDTLKEFDAKLGNHQRNVGNYKSALSGLGGQLGGLPGPIGQSATAFMGFNTALKANPIGAVVGLVVQLIGALSKMQPVMDVLNKAFSVITDSIGFFVQKVGGFLGLVEQTDDTLGSVIAKSQAIADAEVKIRDAKRAQIVDIAKINKEIAKQRLIVADTTKSEQERLAAAEKVSALEEKKLETNIKLAQEELDVAKEKLALDKNNIALKDEVAAKSAALEQAETDSLNFKRELVGQTGALQNAIAAEQKKNDDEAAARRKKAAEDEKKRLEEEKAAIESLAAARRDIDEKSLQDLEKSRQELLPLADTLIGDIDIEDSKGKFALVAELLNQELTSQTIARLEEEGKLVEAAELKKQYRISELSALFQANGMNEYQAFLAAKEQADLEYEQSLKDAKQRELDLEKSITTQKIDLASQAANSVISIGKSIFGETKALAVAQAIIDTLGAAVSVMRDTKGPLWVRLLSAAAITAQGFANVKKILSTKPGGGSASGGGGMAGARPAMSSTAVTPAGSLVSQDFARASIAGQVATDATSRNMADRPVQVMANVDRRGLAIAVREGERSIRTQQFDYK
jgi:hypothetical protein